MAGDQATRNRVRGEGLLDFNPDRNDIDALLYDNIVDDEFNVVNSGRRGPANVHLSSRYSVTNSEASY